MMDLLSYGAIQIVGFTLGLSDLLDVLGVALLAVWVLVFLDKRRTLTNIESDSLERSHLRAGGVVCSFVCGVSSCIATFLTFFFIYYRNHGVMLPIFICIALSCFFVLLMRSTGHAAPFLENKLANLFGCILGCLYGLMILYLRFCVRIVDSAVLTIASIGIVLIGLALNSIFKRIPCRRKTKHPVLFFISILSRCKAGGFHERHPASILAAFATVMVVISAGLSLATFCLPAVFSLEENRGQENGSLTLVRSYRDLMLRETGREYIDDSGEVYAISLFDYSQENCVRRSATYSYGSLYSYNRTDWVDGRIVVSNYTADGSLLSTETYLGSGRLLYQTDYDEEGKITRGYEFSEGKDGELLYRRISAEGVPLGAFEPLMSDRSRSWTGLE